MTARRALLALVPLCIFGPSLAAEITPAQQALIEPYLKEVGSKGAIPRQAVRTAAPDDPSYGDIAFVVLYTHEDPEGLGGNNYEQMLAVFSKRTAVPHPLVVVKVGGKLDRAVSLRKISGNSIELDALLYKSSDSTCCPSVKARVIYRLNGDRLDEATMSLLTTAPTARAAGSFSEVRERSMIEIKWLVQPFSLRRPAVSRDVEIVEKLPGKTLHINEKI